MKFNTFQNSKPLKSAKQLGWDLVVFTDLLKDDSRNVKKIKKADYLESGLKPIIDQSKQLIGGYSNFDAGFYDEDSYIVFGDHTRIFKYIDFPSFVGADGVKVLRNKNKNTVDTKYLYYFLQSIDIPDAGYSRHFKFLKEVIIPVPPLKMQLQIVDIIDKIHFVTKKRVKQIKALSALKQSVFLDMFGDPFINPYNWDVSTLEDFAIINMGQSPPGDSYNNDGEGLPLLNGPTEFKDVYPVAKQWTTKPKRTSEEGDILFCVRGATAGRMNMSDDVYAIGRGLASIKPRNENDLGYIYVVLDYMYDHFQNTSEGSTFINISKKRLEELPIFIVSQEMKEKYNEIYTEIDHNISKCKKSLIDLTMLYESLLQKAFSGDLFKEKTKA